MSAELESPGVNIIGHESSEPRTSPTDTSIVHAAGIVERGRTDVSFKLTSWADALRKVGGRYNWTATAWDSIELFFKRGGTAIEWSRAVGPDAEKATVEIMDAAGVPAVSLVATAIGEGDWYDGLILTFEENPDEVGMFRCVVTHGDDPTVSETSLYHGTQAELINWAKKSEYFRLAAGASALMPDEDSFQLAGGDDDRANITDDEREVALLRFPENTVGQIAYPGATTVGAWERIISVADDTDRAAVLDYPDTGDKATLLTLANMVRERGEVAAGFAGYIEQPHVGGLTKMVPPSLAVCGKISAHDVETNGFGQNKPVAGLKRGVLDGAVGVSQPWADRLTRNELNAAGVNLIRLINGEVVIFGWRSLADPLTNQGWTNFGHRRMHMALTAKLRAVMEPHVFDEIDGEGTLFGEVHGAIVDEVASPYYKEGSLYGSIPEEAYLVEVATVNTPQTIQAKELHASLTVVESEFAETIKVSLVKRLITEGVN